MNDREPTCATAAGTVQSRDRRALTPRFSRAGRYALWTTVGLLVLTGAVWLWAEYLYQPADESLESYEIKHYAMLVHAAFGLAFVFAAGTLLQTHMQMAWQQRRNRASGAVMAAFALLLVLSGYGLWYAGGETLRPLSEWVHWITGFGLPALLLLHALLGRRRYAAHAARSLDDHHRG
jgi:hypothetical protein